MYGQAIRMYMQPEGLHMRRFSSAPLAQVYRGYATSTSMLLEGATTIELFKYACDWQGWKCASAHLVGSMYVWVLTLNDIDDGTKIMKTSLLILGYVEQFFVAPLVPGLEIKSCTQRVRLQYNDIARVATIVPSSTPLVVRAINLVL
jgi:hypothetical protein